LFHFSSKRTLAKTGGGANVKCLRKKRGAVGKSAASYLMNDKGSRSICRREVHVHEGNSPYEKKRKKKKKKRDLSLDQKGFIPGYGGRKGRLPKGHPI